MAPDCIVLISDRCVELRLEKMKQNADPLLPDLGKAFPDPTLCSCVIVVVTSVYVKTAHVDVQNGPLLGHQESRAVTRKLHDAAAVLFGLKFADNIHYKIKSSQASKARLSGGPFCLYLWAVLVISKNLCRFAPWAVLVVSQAIYDEDD